MNTSKTYNTDAHRQTTIVHLLHNTMFQRAEISDAKENGVKKICKAFAKSRLRHKAWSLKPEHLGHYSTCSTYNRIFTTFTALGPVTIRSVLKISLKSDNNTWSKILLTILETGSNIPLRERKNDPEDEDGFSIVSSQH